MSSNSGGVTPIRSTPPRVQQVSNDSINSKSISQPLKLDNHNFSPPQTVPNQTHLHQTPSHSTPSCPSSETETIRLFMPLPPGITQQYLFNYFLKVLSIIISDVHIHENQKSYTKTSSFAFLRVSKRIWEDRKNGNLDSILGERTMRIKEGKEPFVGRAGRPWGINLTEAREDYQKTWEEKRANDERKLKTSFQGSANHGSSRYVTGSRRHNRRDEGLEEQEEGWVSLVVKGFPTRISKAQIEIILGNFLQFWKDLRVVIGEESSKDSDYRGIAKFKVRGEKTARLAEKLLGRVVVEGNKLGIYRESVQGGLYLGKIGQLDFQDEEEKHFGMGKTENRNYEPSSSEYEDERRRYTSRYDDENYRYDDYEKTSSRRRSGRRSRKRYGRESVSRSRSRSRSPERRRRSSRLDEMMTSRRNSGHRRHEWDDAEETDSERRKRRKKENERQRSRSPDRSHRSRYSTTRIKDRSPSRRYSHDRSRSSSVEAHRPSRHSRNRRSPSRSNRSPDRSYPHR